MQQVKTFKHYHDANHGWLAVKLNLLAFLEISKKISSKSYIKGETAYLENDIDMGIFLVAYKLKYGREAICLDVDPLNLKSKKPSPVRNYSHYSYGIRILSENWWS